MEAGLVIYNDSNTIQIDSTYRNMTYVRSRSISSGDQMINPPSSNPRMSATYSESGMMCVPMWDAGGPDNGNKYAVVGSGQFYDFEDIPLTESRAGLNVYRPDGSLSFSSDMSPLRVLYAESGELPDFSDRILYSGVVASGRKVAVILGQQPIKIVADRSGSPTRLRSKGLRVTTNSSGFVEIKFMEYYSVVADVSGSFGDLHYDFLIVDITGF